MVELDANAVEGVPKDKGAPLVADPKNLHLDMVKNEDIAGNESDPNKKKSVTETRMARRVLSNWPETFGIFNILNYC